VNGKLVDSKSVMSLMLLAATQGTQLQLEVEGKDETEALAAIRELIDDKFGEDE
jgi:phosphocarrier protein